ncbi:UNVERIFIED_CONTAM: protein NRT1/ PTR FAMILY 1.2 [Sesamum angustifolium]|uniref:Protein NRT1/ PTR FAMILY 1.2 n=1 Tax=Sesamum angustifolium TaxID=2727405 RepID=A0AAW2M976_9LAMI
MEEKNAMLEEHLLEGTDQKGGFRTLPFIIGIEALEKMATFGLMPNMTLYLMKEYHMEMTTASNLLFFWSAATNFMPLLGALVADSFLGRFYTIGIGSVISLMERIDSHFLPGAELWVQSP